MNQQREAEAEEDLGGENDQGVQPGRAQGIEEEGIAQGPRIVAEADERAVVQRDRLPDRDHEGDGDNDEHGAERRQEDRVRESFLAAAPAPPGPYRLGA